MQTHSLNMSKIGCGGRVLNGGYTVADGKQSSIYVLRVNDAPSNHLIDEARQWRLVVPNRGRPSLGYTKEDCERMAFDDMKNALSRRGFKESV